MWRWTTPLWRRYVSLPPLVESLGASGEAPSMDVAQLKEEDNKALGYLLVTQSSLDYRWRRQVSDFDMTLHQIELETTKAVKEAKCPLSLHHSRCGDQPDGASMSSQSVTCHLSEGD